MAQFVLKDSHHPRLGYDGVIELLLEHGLSAFEIIVEVSENRVEGDLAIVWAVPVIHVGLETLPRAVSIKTKAIVELDQSKLPHPF